MVADGAYLPITHVGSTSLATPTGSTIPLDDIFVCPSVTKSFLSVSKLCDDYPCGVFFDVNCVYIIDLQTQQVLTNGPRCEGLYVLQNLAHKVLYSTRQVAASEIIWYQRFEYSNSATSQKQQGHLS